MKGFSNKLYWFLNRSEAGARRVDFDKRAENVVEPKVSFVSTGVDWEKNPDEYSKKDVVGYDMPRKDIYSNKLHGKKWFYGQKYLKKPVKDIIGEHFTHDETSGMDVLFRTKNFKGDCAGTHSFYHYPKTDKVSHEISIDRNSYKNESARKRILIHEFIHALRTKEGRRTRDRDKEEKKTNLEEIARAPVNSLDWKGGYYKHIPESKRKGKKGWLSVEQMIKSDKSGLVEVAGGKETSLKGKKAKKATKKFFDDSFISKAHFSPAENVDRYFLIKLPNGVTVEEHRFYPTGSNNAKIKNSLKGKYGSNIEVWEWRDGKKVKIMGKKKNNKKRKKRK